MITVTLTPAEVAILDRQAPATKEDGGWQNLLVSLAQKIDRSTNSISLALADLEKIQRYAFTYGHGGWEDRLRSVFERTLGPDLGRQFLKAA